MTGSAIPLRAGILALMRSFIDGKKDAAAFVDRYQRLWKAWRDLDDFADVDGKDAAALDRAFTAADCYSPPRSNPLVTDIDENRLRSEIAELYEILMRSSSQA